ncbi:MAG: HemK/PrmC family methyltransferase [Ginsengibacter sp.]
MNTDKQFNQLKTLLESKLQFLNDKPEETVESTLKACWFAAAGIPKSAEESVKLPLIKLNEEQIVDLNRLIELRLQNIPLAYITGRQSFMGIEFISDKRALIPRKETELLGKKALQLSYDLKNEKPFRVMDICCGAGNLGLAIAHYNTQSEIYCSDLSEYAIDLTKENIDYLNLNNRVTAIAGDLFGAYKTEDFFGKINMVICNPPYISSAKVSKMNIEISGHEPILAFDGGMFGTKIIQRLIMEAPKFLKVGGWVLLEVGVGQGDFILRLFEESLYYMETSSLKDNQGNIRVILAKKNRTLFKEQ